MDDLYHISGSSNLAVLSNDSDPDDDMTTLNIISGPGAGSASVNGLTIDFNPSESGIGTVDVIDDDFSKCNTVQR